MRHLRWFLTRHGILVQSLIYACITSAVWYYAKDYTVHLIFYYMFWVFMSVPFTYFVFLMASGAVNYLRDDFGVDNWFIRKFTEFQLWWSLPVKQKWEFLKRKK